MRIRVYWKVTIAALFVFVATRASWSDDKDRRLLNSGKKTAIDFERDIRPVLAARCFACHGAKKQESGLRLDIKKAALVGGDSGKAIIPGKSKQSEFIRRITSDDKDERMPPEGKRLTSEQIAKLTRWIDQGAVWPDDGKSLSRKSDHWAFQPVVRPPLPELKSHGNTHPIDAFIQARLAKEGLKPSPLADRATLLRRLSQDLTGLPPSVDEIEKFLSDERRPDAYERLVDHLLRSIHYGELWAQYWLDLARYADSDGYEKDLPRPNAWRWRDWVIDAINRDLPYDQFAVQQIAGDLLPGGARSPLIATGFHRNSLTNREGGVDQEEYRIKAVKDRLSTTLTSFMAMTIDCAECHSHKYDPITQREYYGLYAFFNNADEKNIPAEPTAAVLAKFEAGKAAHQKKIAAVQAKLDAERPELEKRLTAWEQQRRKQIDWSPLKLVSLKSASGSTIEEQPDGSILVGGANPANDQFTVVGETALSKITAIRLEALADKSLPSNGPGRADDGRFLLSHFAAASRPRDGSLKEGALLLQDAHANVELPNFSIIGSLDSDKASGWSIGRPSGKNATAVFEVASKSLKPAWLGNKLVNGSQDTATQTYNFYYQSTIPVAGTIDRFKVFTMAKAGAAFGIHLIRPLSGGSYRIVYRQDFTADGKHGIKEYQLSKPWQVRRGDVFAHSGNGGPVFRSVKTEDVLYYPVQTFPKQASAVDLTKYPVFSSKRDYAMQVFLAPSVTSTDFIKPEWNDRGATLTFTLAHNHARPHQTLGRFQLTVTDAADPLGKKKDTSVPDDVLAILQVDANERSLKEADRLLAFFAAIDKKTAPIKRQLDNLKKKTPKRPTAVAHVMTPRSSLRKSFIHRRGNFLDKGDEVATHTPTFLPDLAARGELADRLDLARWVVNPSNPLTARVAVNHIWAKLFGRGIVKTTEDFGTQGEPPTHPRLLDWLADEFIRLGWSRKALIKLIVTSETYRRSSVFRPELTERDPRNLLLARQNRFRLDAERIRDHYLAAGGLLNRRSGGPSFRPELPSGVAQIQFINKWVADKGDVVYRRSLYIHLQRNLMLPMLMTFDHPDSIVVCTRRERSNTPLQALTLLNAPLFFESAHALGRGLAADKSATTEQRIRRVFLSAVSREPNRNELYRVMRLVGELTDIYKKNKQAAKDLAGDNPPPDVPIEETAAWVAVARAILNLDEVITRE